MTAEWFCSSCNAAFANGWPLDEDGVCRSCRSGLRGYDSAASFGFYEGNLRSLIHLFKYAGMTPLAKPLAELLERTISPEQQFDAIIPVPLHWHRQWQRGFNQAELLARHISKRRRIPMLNAVRRKRATGIQAGLALAGRRRNVAGAFELRRGFDLTGGNLTGRRILLVDDVMTTGATASACAAAIKRGGAVSVSLLTLARVDRR
jgi:ComF family protein